MIRTASDFATAILDSIKTSAAFKTMTGAQIGALLMEHVWSEISVFTPQSELVEEAARRLGGIEEWHRDS